MDEQGNEAEMELGRANLGWTVGEEILYDKNMQIRSEKCYAESESCLLGI